jgi:hypothetical protein
VLVASEVRVAAVVCAVSKAVICFDDVKIEGIIFACKQAFESIWHSHCFLE